MYKRQGNTVALRIIIIVILLALSAYFSSAETALTMVNKIRMRTLADDGNKAAACVLKLHENKGKMLSAILLSLIHISRDSEKLLGILETIGYQAVETEDADFVLYNTCTAVSYTHLTDQGTVETDALILAAGSKAAPSTGSDGSGYEYALSLIHI